MEVLDGPFRVHPFCVEVYEQDDPWCLEQVYQTPFLEDEASYTPGSAHQLVIDEKHLQDKSLTPHDSRSSLLQLNTPCL